MKAEQTSKIDCGAPQRLFPFNRHIKNDREEKSLNSMNRSTSFARTSQHTRIGQLIINETTICTPFLFPVVPLISGTTPRGGGIWKYIVQAHPYALMRRNKPLINQVLQFLDFSISPNILDHWRSKSLREHYNSEFPDLNYHGPIFTDSGGFKLLWNAELDLSSFGIHATPETILAIQKDFGSDLIATLDYPLPPGLQRSEAEERMRKSQDNVLSTLHLLKEMPDYNPFVYAAVHGQNSDDIRLYVEHLFSQIQDNGFTGVPLGIAIGSLVPLRGAQKVLAIIDIVQGALAGIPEQYRCTTPVHIFGVTGNLIPLLAYLGVDTFDSSTYVQMARTLRYFDPIAHRFLPFLEMEELHCNCSICQKVDLLELQEGLTAKTQPCKPLANGVFKSKYYADIALHNLEMDYQTVQETRLAIEANALEDYLVKHIEHFPQLSEALTLLAQSNQTLQVRMSKVIQPAPAIKKFVSPAGTISLKYTPEAFNIISNGYRPPTEKRVLLIIPCSGEKPYSTSRTHRLINERLSQALSHRALLVHKVTLSGLYGPVPEEYENETAVLNYDFRLDSTNEAQIGLLIKRLQIFLERFGDCYIACLAYATSRPYRMVLEEVAKQITYLQVLPVKPKSRRLTEFFRGKNIEQLLERVSYELNTVAP